MFVEEENYEDTYLKKFKGQNEQLVPKSTISEIIFAFIGSFIAIGIIGYCTKTYDNLLIMGSFGASLCITIWFS